MGLDVEIFDAEPGRPNIVATYRGARPAKLFHFYGHMDVVPLGNLSEWDWDLFSADEVERWIYDKGTVDMKSGLAPMIMATDFLKRSKLNLAGDISLTIVSDEQRGGQKGHGIFLTKELLKGILE